MITETAQQPAEGPKTARPLIQKSIDAAMREAVEGPPADPIDLHVGARIRRIRRGLGVSQEALADELGLTFQQVQKYEKGANRVSASKLARIAAFLKTPIGYFFDGAPLEGLRTGEVAATEEDLTVRAFSEHPEGRAVILDLCVLKNPAFRQIGDTIKLMADLTRANAPQQPED